MVTGSVTINQKTDALEKLERLAQRAGWIIFELKSSTWPSFSRVTICPNRVTVSTSGWFSKDEYPIPIENVTGARIFKGGPFFATLHIETFGFSKPEPINKVKVNDARLARRYILALVECKKAGIDLAHYDLPNLREKLNSIGTVREGGLPIGYHII